MNGERRTREQSRDRKHDHEIKGIQKQQHNSQAVEFQKKLNRASTDLTEKLGQPGRDNPRLSSKTSSDTDSDFKVHHRIAFADMGEEEANVDEFSLKSKYKKANAHKGQNRDTRVKVWNSLKD